MLFAGALTTLPSVLFANKSYAAWPKKSFDIKDLEDSVKSVYGHNDAIYAKSNENQRKIIREIGGSHHWKQSG